jgi:hypothetical protein
MQADFAAIVSSPAGVTRDKLSPVLLLPAINYCQCHCYRRLIIAGVVVTGDKLIAGVVDTGNKRKVSNFRKHLKWFQ